MDGMPTVGMPLQKRSRKLRNHVELFEVEFLPGNRWIGLQTGLAFFALLVNRCINLLQLTTNGVRDDLRPGFIGFSESDSISMAPAAISPQSLVGYFGNVRSSHDDWHAGGTNGISHAVGASHHPGHRTNTNQSDLLLNNEVYELMLVHWPGISVNQKHLMFGRSQCLEQEHPQMRHEIAGHAVIRIVKKNLHRLRRDSPLTKELCERRSLIPK